MSGTLNVAAGSSTYCVPVGLAKLFQHFAPYVDTLTGTTYLYSGLFHPTGSGDTAHHSIDNLCEDGSVQASPTAKPWEYINSPLERYLLVSNYPSGLFDYAAMPGLEFNFSKPILNNLPWNQIYATTEYGVLTRIVPSLCQCVQVKDIPYFAPDGSAYTYWNETYGIRSPIPDFDSGIAYLLGTYSSYFDNDPTPILTPYPYQRPLPYVSWVGVQYFEDAYMQVRTLAQVYFTVMLQSTEWSDSLWTALITPQSKFYGIRRLTYERSIISTNKIAQQILDTYKTGNWTDLISSNEVYNNSQMSYVCMIWNLIYQRNFEWLAIPHFGQSNLTEDAPYTAPIWNSSCFFSATSTVSSYKLPAAIIRSIQTIGPIVVDGSVRFPAIYPDQCINNSMAASSSRRYLSWFDSLSDKWHPNNVVYGMNVSEVKNGGVTIYTPGTSTPLTVPRPVGWYSFGWYGVNQFLFANLIGQYQSKIPANMGLSRWIPIDDDLMGSVTCSLSIVGSTSQVQSTTVFYSNTLLSDQTLYTVQSVSSYLCLTNEDAFNVGTFSLYLENITPVDSPLFVEFVSSYTFPLFKVMQDSIQSSNSNFSDLVQAGLVRGGDISAAALDYQDSRLDGYRNEVVANNTPFYDSMKKWAHKAVDGTYEWARAHTMRMAGRAFFDVARVIANQYFVFRRNGPANDFPRIEL